MRISRGRVAAALLAASAVATAMPAAATELPPSGSVFQIQTNGATAAVTLGDWYTSTAVGAGAGHHYVTFTVPCGWPATTPVHVDLFSPEMNQVAGALAQTEEPSGTYDSTQFELYGPGAVVGPGTASPAPGAGIAGTQITYQPGAPGVPESWVRYVTLGAPVACGQYVLRAQVFGGDPLNPGGGTDDQNGWRVRVGSDDDADPTTGPPAGYDDPDGLPGTNDEIVLGTNQVSFQHDAGGVACQTFFQYVDPGQPTATFHNFDMDGNTRLRYYAPSDASYVSDATSGGIVGTLSGNGIWNGGTLSTRGGDSVVNPETGWWRIVSCLSSHNQLIQEGQAGVAQYYAQPPTPSLILAIDDGLTQVAPGQTVTYGIDATNVAAGATAGAANAVVVRVTLPAGVTYVGCAVPTPADGTWVCSEAAGVVTYTQTGWIDAGAMAQLDLTVAVDQGTAGPIVMPATVDHQDQLGNPFPPSSASDTDAVVPAADLRLDVSDSADPVQPGQAFDYLITVTNDGPSDATGLTLTDAVPSAFTVTGVASGSGTCGFIGNDVTCTLGSLAATGTWNVTVNVTVGATTPAGVYANTPSVAGAEADPNPSNNLGTEETTVGAAADLRVEKTASVEVAAPGDTVTYTITITNDGPSDATNVTVTDAVPSVLDVTAVGSAAGTCSNVANDVTCSLASLTAAGSWVITIDAIVDADAAPGTVTNTATVAADEPDPDVTDDSDGADLEVTSPAEADIAVTMTQSATEPSEGDEIRYVVTVSNEGPADGTGVVVSDPIPDQLEFVAAVAATGSYDEATGEWLVGALAMGETATLTLEVRVAQGTAGSSITNEARVVARDLPDPVSENDVVAMAVTILGAADELAEEAAALAAEDQQALAATGRELLRLLLLAIAAALLGGILMALGTDRSRETEAPRTTF